MKSWDMVYLFDKKLTFEKYCSMSQNLKKCPLNFAGLNPGRRFFNLTSLIKHLEILNK
jgi:hypothetical protein